MATSDNVVAFPSIPPASSPTTTSPRKTSVRTIAARLAPSGHAPGDEAMPSLSIDLSDLTGVDDETIGRLTISAVEGYITCSSAARLALRHARELRQADEPFEDADLTGSLEGAEHHDTCLRLALRAGAVALDMAIAPIWSRDRIVESGFPAGPAVAVFTGRDLDGHVAFATVATADWRTAILRLPAAPAYAFADRVHLFHWLGARRSRTRASMSVELARRIALYGRARRLGRSRSSRPQPQANVRGVAHTALLLIAATHPAIIDGSQS